MQRVKRKKKFNDTALNVLTISEKEQKILVGEKLEKQKQHFINNKQSCKIIMKSCDANLQQSVIKVNMSNGVLSSANGTMPKNVQTQTQNPLHLHLLTFNALQTHKQEQEQYCQHENEEVEHIGKQRHQHHHRQRQRQRNRLYRYFNTSCTKSCAKYWSWSTYSSASCSAYLYLWWLFGVCLVMMPNINASTYLEPDELIHELDRPGKSKS